MIKTKQRYIPPGSQPIIRDLIPGAVVYLSEAGNRYLAMGFRSERQVNHDFFHNFMTVEKRDRFVDAWFDRIGQAQGHKLARQAQKRERNSQPNPFRPGMLLHYSWGYDQTNCEYYQVVHVKNRQVVIRRIGASSVGPDGFMSTNLFPEPDVFVDDELLTKTVQFDGQGGPRLKMDHGSAHIWDGRAHYSSWYA